MVTLAEPKPIHDADERPDGSRAPAAPEISIHQNQSAVPMPLVGTVAVDPNTTRSERLSRGIAGIYDWLVGSPATHKQRLDLEVAEINERRTARVTASDF